MNTPVIALDPALRRRCIDTVRMLSVDAVEAAKSGHPGACLGGADLVMALWAGPLRFDPAFPAWANRDRFVLSKGHASMLLYSMLHLAGYDLTMDEIRRFRQLDSRATGHPEFPLLPGVETTTGPLAQGFATSVGMALASRMLAVRYNTPDFQPVTWRVFGYCGDGDLMEGLSYEAASLAGHLGLGNLVYVYDANQVSIEGGIELAFTEDVGRRFEALGWHVQHCDGYDTAALDAAIAAATVETDRPSLVIARTVIGRGAPTMAGTARTHGAPLGPNEVAGLKAAEGWPAQPTFLVPDDVRAAFQGLAAAKAAERAAWDAGFARWRASHPDLAARWDSDFGGHVPTDLGATLLAAALPEAGKATRVISGKVMQALHRVLPDLVGGSADLGPSNNTVLDGAGDVGPGSYDGANLHFGVREHAMAAVTNGLALSGGFRPFCATFLVFSDYLKPAVRMAALMGLPVTFVFSHDSFHVGEDGPTHQPIEHLLMLRSIPGLTVFRPADAVEVAAAWAYAARRDRGPVCIVTTRQNVPRFARPDAAGIDATLRGAVVIGEWLAEGRAAPDRVIVATGSEVSSCVAAAPVLAARGLSVRVVSMPSVELFLAQDAACRDAILPPGVPRVSVEALTTIGWHRVLGDGGVAIGLDRFGVSAPAAALNDLFGFTPERLAARIYDAVSS